MDNQNKKVNTYVISLDIALERRKQIETTFGKYNQEYTIFSAIDGCDKKIMKELNKKYNSSIGYCQSACAISHIKVLEQFIETNDQYIIIMEDDAVLEKPLPTTVDEVESIFKEINVENPDIVYLHNNVRCNKKYKIIGGHGTFGYIYSRKGAIKTIKSLYPLNKPIDCYINNNIKNGFLNGYRSKDFYIKHYDKGNSFLEKERRIEILHLLCLKIIPVITFMGGVGALMYKDRKPI